MRVILQVLLFIGNMDYQILKVKEIDVLLSAENRDREGYDLQLKTNWAFVYFLKSGKVVVLPNHRNDNDDGILFSNKQVYEETILNDHFPVIAKNKNFLEEKAKQLIKLNSYIDSIIIAKEKKFGIGSQINEVSRLQRIEKIITQFFNSSKKMSSEDKFDITLIIGEYVRIINNGKWILLKQYGVFNPYYEPAIEYPNKNFLFILGEASQIFYTKPFSLEKFINNSIRINEPKNNENNTYAFSFIREIK